MSSFGQRSLQLVHATEPAGSEALSLEYEMARDALTRERSYQVARERNRRRATKRAGSVLRRAAAGRKGDK